MKDEFKPRSNLLKDFIEHNILPPFIKKSNKSNKSSQNSEYIHSTFFKGDYPGYIFKNGENGVGYYKIDIELEPLKTPVKRSRSRK